ncbi:MazG-like family [Sebaldella termitidis]|jgi:NTP pyrophosphatase (non-canonical NTP hydrolase)|uniref:MazG nucleotide pyrophosphohydrolase n=1 Tax=Sebaldella termitidis (strain ATCC 33386 / NCTC 11300) TaxID=526218 RepID=D1AHY8_SEBTE|nr:nucleotide pyrophosphohydrolase [Sebaldella termitidis]ACZ08372.1 MazG nucleotide pyrophosphohydrolase [Sebaldella termitidis ATCC 33386]SUI23684.1 MazG-like family [Sebaldella termitidis]
MTYEDIRNELREFVAERNWEQYHNLKDLALSVSIEASELVEIFQWRNPEDINDEDRQNIKLELADVLIYIFFMCDKLGIEPYEIIKEKMEINKKRVFKF